MSTIVMVDADASIPEVLRADLPLRQVPDDAPVLMERVAIPRLALEREPVAAEHAVEASAQAAREGSGVVLVSVGDAYGNAPDAIERAGDAVRAQDAPFAACATGQALMAAGWPAVIAAEAVQRGANAAEAAAAASQAAGSAHLLAYFEHPELVGLADTPSPTARAVGRIKGEACTLIASMPRRDGGLMMLRDRFHDLVSVDPVKGDHGALRVAVHHAGTPPAAEAMAKWIERNTDAAQVVVAPLTRHAAARYGPGFVAIAWVRDPGYAA